MRSAAAAVPGAERGAAQRDGRMRKVCGYPALASTTLRGEAVCTTRVIRNPAWLSRSRYSAAVRSRDAGFSSISRSAHFPAKSRSWVGMTNSTSNTVAWGPAAALSSWSG